MGTDDDIQINAGLVTLGDTASNEVVVLPPIDTSTWTLDRLDDEIEAVRARYVEILEPGSTG